MHSANLTRRVPCPWFSVIRSAFCGLIAASGLLGILTSPPAMAGQSAVTTRISISGDLVQPMTLDAARLQALPHQPVPFTGHHGSGTYAAIPLTQLLASAGLPLKQGLRGRQLACYLMVTARDGYQVVFSLAELAPAYGGLPVFLADAKDGQALTDFEGPYRVLVPNAPRPARSPRQVSSIEVHCPAGTKAPSSAKPDHQLAH